MTSIARHDPRSWLRSPWTLALLVIGFLFMEGLLSQVLAHGVAEGDKGYIQETSGFLFWPFVYLGAKHMVTGYDHLLFLFGVIFFLYRMKDISIYVTLFAIGHSSTLLLGVLTNISVSSYVVDAIIGLSVVYKALDNMGAFQRWFGFQPSTKGATLIFGLFHGFGLATKLQDFQLSPDGLFLNLVAFNIGVEIGQLLALGGILILMGFWRRSNSFWEHAYLTNVVLMTLGFLLTGYQLRRLLRHVIGDLPCTTQTVPPVPTCLRPGSCSNRPASPPPSPPCFWSPSSCRPKYGVDPTRVGSIFGLTEMGRIKVQLAAEAEADAAADAAAGSGLSAAPPLDVATPAAGATAPRSQSFADCAGRPTCADRRGADR